MADETPAREPRRKCVNCTRGPQPLSEFVSKKDETVLSKRCAKCRAKDVARKQTPEVRARVAARNRERKYYEKYRAKKRAEDAVAFRRHNAAVTRARRESARELEAADAMLELAGG